MKKWNLKIILKSDLCSATGEDVPGITNIKTAIEHGVPYIPAKRIKGCLAEAGREMLDNGVLDRDGLDNIFGKSGSDRIHGIHITDARLYSFPEFLFGEEADGQVIIEDYGLFQEELCGCGEEEKAYFEEFFTRQRTRTAMDGESGTAKRHSLRTMQVIPAGVTFISCIEGDLNEENESALRNCVKGLRHMGIGITRGMGEVRCELEAVSEGKQKIANNQDITNEYAKILKNFHPEEEVTLSYEIELDSPVSIDEESGYLPAGAVLGAVAGMYIKKFSLGQCAHKDENFRRIFLRDGVQFGYGFLKRGNKIFGTCPKEVAESKDDEGHWFIIEGDKLKKRKAILGQVCWEENRLHVLPARKEIHFHHSRPADRGIGHALNDQAADTTSFTGEFFQYTALSKRQIYAGVWSGRAKDIECLAECLQENGYRLRLGRSKTAEYGNCSFRITDVSLKKKQSEFSSSGTEWMLWFLTPLISRDKSNGEYTLKPDVFQQQLEEKLKCKVLELRKIAGSSAIYSGYNSRWRLPSVSCPAAEAGTTFYLKTDKEIQTFDLEKHRWGELTGRGCGQAAVRTWEPNQEGTIIIGTGEEPMVEFCPGGLVDRLLRSRKLRLECADTDIVAEKLKAFEKELPPSSAISLLAQLLRYNERCGDFYKKIEQEVNHISKIEKRNKILEFIKPCEGRSSEFMKLYLESAKWKARGAGDE